MVNIETQEQKQDRIHKHLDTMIARMQQVTDAPTDVMLKRIEVDAAAIAALTVISELLPEPLQQQVRTIVALHEETWNINMPVDEGETPRKPLTAELLEQVALGDTSEEG